MVQEIGWLALGGAGGGMARYWIAGLVAGIAGDRFPFGTLVVNVSGSLGLGWVLGHAAPGDVWLAGHQAQALVVVGLLASYTTVSSFSLQTLALAQGGAVRLALLNAALTLPLCLGAAWLGFRLASPGLLP